jgi:hypothetical protein
MHTWDNAFFWAADDFGSDLRISQLYPILLDRLT